MFLKINNSMISYGAFGSVIQADFSLSLPTFYSLFVCANITFLSILDGGFLGKSGFVRVIDAYTAYVLEIYSSISKNIPQYNWKNIMVNFAKSSINDKLAESEILFKYKTKKISVDEIVAEPQKYVVKGNGVINRQIISRISKEQINIIFSMWKGYLDKPSWFDNYKDIIIPLHTSGHAYIEHLQKLIEQMQPKNLIPIHTEFKSKFKEFFDSNVIELDDGQEYPI